MRDALEERLAARLGALGDTVDDELPPPVDLELQVLRRRRRTKATRRWSSLAVAAAIIVVAASSLAAVHGSSGHGSIQVASSSTMPAAGPALDSLQPGTVMLSARGRYVISLDSRGRQNATMVSVKLGVITYARATDDHRALWYLSIKNGTKTCGDVVRADIYRGNVSTIVTHAVAFDVSPDGSRLALYGAGDLAHDRCAPVKSGAPGRIVVLDLTTGTSSAATTDDVTSLRWSSDGSYLAANRCWTFGCSFQRVDVPARLGTSLRIENGTQVVLKHWAAPTQSVAFGSDGLYVLSRMAMPAPPGVAATTAGSVQRYNARTFASPVTVIADSAHWDVRQVVPTAVGTYVVAAPVTTTGKSRVVGLTGLYRIVGPRLVFVRSLDAPGTLVPVNPLP